MAIIRVSIFLALVCLLSASTLSKTFEITKPVIAKNEAKKLKESLSSVIPGSTVFASQKFGEQVVHVGLDAENKVTGCAMVTAPQGYAGPIKLLVGITREGKFTSYMVQSMLETPGLGTKAKEPKFREQKAWTEISIDKLPKVTKDKGTIDAITAATISSRAVCKGVEEALTIFKTNRDAILAIVPETPMEEKTPAPETGQVTPQAPDTSAPVPTPAAPATVVETPAVPPATPVETAPASVATPVIPAAPAVTETAPVPPAPPAVQAETPVAPVATPTETTTPAAPESAPATEGGNQ